MHPHSLMLACLLAFTLSGCDRSTPAPPAASSVATATTPALRFNAPPGFDPTKFRISNRMVLTDSSGVIKLEDFDFRCAHPSASHDDKNTACADIPVLVLWEKDTEKCWSLVPYNRLVVNTNGKKQTKVTWSIVGPKNATFAASGIELKAKDETGVTPYGDIYEDIGNEGTDSKKFKMTVKQNAAPNIEFGHHANIVIGATVCQSIDPLIVNKEN